MTADWSVLGASGQNHSIDDLTDVLVKGDGQWPLVIAHHNLHSLYLLRESQALKEFFSQVRVVHIDGMSIVWLARLLGHETRREHRVTYVDWLPRVLEEASKREWRVFFLGSTARACARGVSEIQARYPRLTIEGRDGYFDTTPNGADDEAVVERIRAFNPDLLLVGMGMPRQEGWILSSGIRTGARRILPCGAAVDYLAGAVSTPPRWLGRLGLEWAFRLLHEPTRLGRRYLVEPLYLLMPFATEFLRKRLR